jgi:RHS repeat-associated protein
VSKTVVAKFSAVEQVSYYDADAIGSTRLITDAQGNPVERHNYTPFGVEMTQPMEMPQPTGLTPRLFAGKPRDPGTQFDYFGARYYSASTGRFISADPIIDRQRSAVAPQRWARYGYVLQNPLRFGDPDGRETQLIVGFITENSPVGHVAIAINGVVFSYGTNWTKGPYHDWGVSLDKYLAAQEKLRQTAVVTLAVSPQREAALLKELRTHNPNLPGSPKYSIVYGNTCVTTCEKALQKAGILPGAGPVRIDGAGNLLQAGAPSHDLPFSFALYVNEQGLPVYAELVGEQKVTWWQSVWNALKNFVGADTTDRRDD